MPASYLNILPSQKVKVHNQHIYMDVQDSIGSILSPCLVKEVVKGVGDPVGEGDSLSVIRQLGLLLHPMIHLLFRTVSLGVKYLKFLSTARCQGEKKYVSMYGVRTANLSGGPRY